MSAALELVKEKCEYNGVNWEQWFEKGAEMLKPIVKDLADIVTQGGMLEDMSNALWKRAPEIFAPILQEALQAKANMMDKDVACPSCGKICKSSRKFPRKLDTRNGSITIERNYHNCSNCKVGFFPFDLMLGLTTDRKQSDLQRAAVELFTELPYNTASSLFTTLTGLSFSDHAMHDLATDLGDLYEIKDVLPTVVFVKNLIDEHTVPGKWAPVLVVSADGAHVPTRPFAESRNDERGPGEWKEAKGFRIYLAEHDRIVQIMSWHQIENEEQFGKDIRYAASLIPSDAVRIALVGDGAPWIWNHLTAAFPQGQEILDYYHCKERIHKVANIQYSGDASQRISWIESTMSRLFYGEVDSVIWGLQRMKACSEDAANEVSKLITYLTNNAHRIDYSSARRRQFPCGSGGIESSNKSISHTRLKRSGAWWNEENANTMLALRCAKYNGTLDSLYKSCLKRRQNLRLLGSKKMENS